MGPVLTGALVGLAGDAANAALTGATNRKQRKWSEKMYQRQRNDALADRDFENFYNSPAEQMKRLTAGGLNPNLVYGNGAAQQESAGTKAASVESWKPQAMRVDPANALATGYDLAFKQVQTDNVKAATEVAKQEVLLKAIQAANTAAQTAKTQTDTKRAEFDLGVSSDLRETTIEAAKANLQKVQAETTATETGTQLALNRDEREALMNAQNLKKGVEEILNLRLSRAKTQEEINHIKQQIENLKSSKEMTDLDNELRRLGVQPSDPYYIRVAARLAAGKGAKTPEQVLQSVKENGTKFVRKGVKEAVRAVVPWGRAIIR